MNVRVRCLLELVACVLTAITIAGCGTASKLAGNSASPVSEQRPVTQVNIRVSDIAREKFRQESKGFEADALAAAVRNKLEEIRLFVDDDRGDGVLAEIVITDLRFRSTTAAAVLGLLAGFDEITADVRLVPPRSAGPEFRFALATRDSRSGIFHSSMPARLEALYDSFAEGFVEVVSGMPRCAPRAAPLVHDRAQDGIKCRDK